MADLQQQKQNKTRKQKYGTEKNRVETESERKQKQKIDQPMKQGSGLIHWLIGALQQIPQGSSCHHIIDLPESV